MSLEDKKINKVEIIEKNGIQKLTDRPNLSTEYGGNALTAEQLKLKFDALPTAIIEAFNTLVEYLGTEAFASDLKTSDTDFDTLAALVTAIRNGGFADILKVKTDEEQTLTQFVESVGSGVLAQSLNTTDEKYTTLAALVAAIRDGGFADILKVSNDETLTEAIEKFEKELQDGVLKLNADDKQTVNSDVKFNKSVSIDGDLSVKGKHYVVEANSLFVKDKFIACNFLEADKAEPGVRGTAGFLMISGAKDYNELGETIYPAYGIVYNYFKDCVLLGKGHINYQEYWKEESGQYYVDFTFDEGEAQAIATRSDTIKNGNLVKWDDDQKKMVDAETSLNFFAPERVAQKGQFLFINTEKGSMSYSEAMAGLVIPASGFYDGADEKIQDGYAIVYDPKTKTLRLGTGTIIHSKNIYTGAGEIDYKHFTFGIEDSYLFENAQEDEAIATRADNFEEGHIPIWQASTNMFVDSGKTIGDIGSGGSGGGISVEDIIASNIPNGSLVRWNTYTKKLEAAYSASKDAINNTVAIRGDGGGIKVGSKTGDIDWAANIRTVEMAQSFNYVNYFPSAANENGEHIVAYVEAGFVAVGWQDTSKVEPGILTGVPHSNVGDTWYQRVCNGSPNSKTLVVRNALVWGDTTSLSRMMNAFTDKVEDAWNVGNDLYIKVAPKCTIYIQSRIVNKGYSQISIT